MNERAEFFAILTALIAEGKYRSMSTMIDASYRIWYDADQCCKDAGLTNGVSACTADNNPDGT